MKTKIVVLMLLALAAGAAQAQYHPQPNLLGVYFDTQANSIRTWANPLTVVTSYVILTDPTMAAIDGWEAGFAIAGHGVILNGIIPNSGSNSRSGTMYSVTYPTPLACSEHTVLMTLPLLAIESSGVDNCISMFGVDSPAMPGDSPVLYVAGGVLVQAPVNAPPGYDVVAQLNGGVPLDSADWPMCAGVVSDLQANWGSVKAAYR